MAASIMRLQLTSCVHGIATGILLIGCTSDFSPLTPAEREVLAKAETRWAAAGIVSYTVDMRRDCDCLYKKELVHLRVAAGLVTSAHRVTSGEPLRLDGWLSVEQLFQRLHWTADHGSYYQVDAQYDPDLGYPTWSTFGAEPSGTALTSTNHTYVLSGLRPAS